MYGNLKKHKFGKYLLVPGERNLIERPGNLLFLQTLQIVTELPCTKQHDTHQKTAMLKTFLMITD